MRTDDNPATRFSYRAKVSSMNATDADDRLAEEERLAQVAYDRYVRPTVRPEDEGKYVAVAFDTGESRLTQTTTRPPGDSWNAFRGCERG